MKPPLYMVDSRADGSLTRRSKDPFAIFEHGNLVNKHVILQLQPKICTC